MKYLVMPLILLFSLITIGQLDFEEHYTLKNIKCKFIKDKSKGEHKTLVRFEFSSPGVKYFHVRRGDTLFIQFYNTDAINVYTELAKPFTDIRIADSVENLRPIEQLAKIDKVKSIVQLREIVIANIPLIMISSCYITRGGLSHEDIDSGTKRDQQWCG